MDKEAPTVPDQVEPTEAKEVMDQLVSTKKLAFIWFPSLTSTMVRQGMKVLQEVTATHLREVPVVVSFGSQPLVL
jgi:hypothetical protein